MSRNRVLLFLFAIFSSSSAWSYHRGPLSENFSSIIEVVNSKVNHYCYVPFVTEVSSNPGDAISLYLAPLPASQSSCAHFKYDVYGRLSTQYHHVSYCLTAPKKVVDSKTGWDWLTFNRCEVGSPYQQWEIKSDSSGEVRFYLHGTEWPIQHYYYGGTLYGALCTGKGSSGCYAHSLSPASQEMEKHYAQPHDLSVPLFMTWDNAGVTYHIDYLGAHTTETSNAYNRLQYDPVRRQISYRSYHLVSKGSLYHEPTRMCLVSPDLSHEASHGVSWVACDESVSPEDVPGNQRWVATRVNMANEILSSLFVDVHWRDNQGHYLSLNSSGSFLVINKYNQGKQQDPNFLPAVFHVWGEALPFFDFEARAYLKNFDNQDYCLTKADGLPHTQVKRFQDYLAVLEVNLLHHDTSACQVKGEYGLFCQLDTLSNLFVLNRPITQTYFLYDLKADVPLDFIKEHRPSFFIDMNQSPKDYSAQLMWMESALDKVVPSHFLLLDTLKTLPELMDYLDGHSNTMYLVLSHYENDPMKLHSFVVINENDEEFSGNRIVDDNIASTYEAQEAFSEAFDGEISLLSFFTSKGLDPEHITVIKIVEGERRLDQDAFYTLRDCTDQDPKDTPALETVRAFSLQSVYSCSVRDKTGEFFRSRCWIQ